MENSLGLWELLEVSMKKGLLFLAALCIATDGLAQGLVLKYSGRFLGSMYPNITLQRSPSWSDFDGNGWPDMIVQGFENPNVCTVYGFPGMIPLWSSPFACAVNSDYPFFMDVTGDGIKDVIYRPSSPPSSIAVHSVTANACILLCDSVAFGCAGEPVFLSDYDGDGIPDISVFICDLTPMNCSDRRLEIWGAGTVSSSAPSELVILPRENVLTLSWTPVDSCSMYEIQWSFPFDSAWATVGTSCLPYFEHPGAAILPRAFYRVVAITSTSGPRIIGPATYSESKGQQRR
jgi:hypothetical protein